MFSMKFFNNKLEKSVEVEKTINNVISFIKEKLKMDNTRVISDSSCIEVVSGKELSPKDDEVVIELLIRKHIIINNNDFKDRDQLDKHMSKIRHFCEQAKSIEDLKYLPINMR